MEGLSGERRIPRLRSLLQLTSIIGPDAFGWVKPRIAWKIRFEEKNFETVAQCRRLGTIREAKNLALLSGQDQYAKSPEENQLWKDNVEDMETYLSLVVTQDRYPSLPATALAACPSEIDSGENSKRCLKALKMSFGVQVGEEGLTLDAMMLQSILLVPALNSPETVHPISPTRWRKTIPIKR